MILLSFISGLKYVIGLMLVMLGLIPYEEIESNSNPEKLPEKDTILIEQVNISSEPASDNLRYSCAIKSIAIPETDQGDDFIRIDSAKYILISLENDSLTWFDRSGFEFIEPGLQNYH